MKVLIILILLMLFGIGLLFWGIWGGKITSSTNTTSLEAGLGLSNGLKYF